MYFHVDNDFNLHTKNISTGNHDEGEYDKL